MRALRIYAGPAARVHLERHGLQPSDVRCVPAAAGGPKGLMLGRLDKFIFGEWLPRSHQQVHLVGASIGAWRMATACLADCQLAFGRLEHDYIAQHYALQPGERRPPAEKVSEQFASNLQAFFGGRVDQVVHHPRYVLHLLTARGRHVLSREGKLRTPMGYAGAFVSNAVARRTLGWWLERVVFSSPPAPGGTVELPFRTGDLATRQISLSSANFMGALQASCSIPFLLKGVQGIAGAPDGCYWDGGITDYHLHLNYTAVDGHTSAAGVHPGGQIVLYPHFQQSVVPGWLDKGLRWRHRPTRALDNLVVLAPDPAWVQTLPNGKLPDRQDFVRYAHDFEGRRQVWQTAVDASQQLADEFASWLDRPDTSLVSTL